MLINKVVWQRKEHQLVGEIEEVQRLSYRTVKLVPAVEIAIRKLKAVDVSF